MKEGREEKMREERGENERRERREVRGKRNIYSSTMENNVTEFPRILYNKRRSYEPNTDCLLKNDCAFVVTYRGISVQLHVFSRSPHELQKSIDNFVFADSLISD